jgi:hypothetical protein
LNAVEAERSAREAKSTREMFERLQRVYDEQQLQSEQNIKSLMESLEHTSIAREQEKSTKEECQEQNKELRIIIDKYRSQSDSNRMAVYNVEKMKETEIYSLKNTIKDLQKELQVSLLSLPLLLLVLTNLSRLLSALLSQEKSRNLTKKTKEHDELSQSFDHLVALHEKKYTDELALYKLKHSELDKSLKELEILNNSSETRLSMVIEQLKEKYNLQLMTLESKLKNEMEKNRNMLAKSK